MQQLVDELVHVAELVVAVPLLGADLPVVVEERLKVLVAVQGGAGQPAWRHRFNDGKAWIEIKGFCFRQRFRLEFRQTNKAGELYKPEVVST